MKLKNKKKEIMILKRIMFVLFVCLQIVAVSSCSDDDSNKAHLSVSLTDAPDFDTGTPKIGKISSERSICLLV